MMKYLISLFIFSCFLSLQSEAQYEKRLENSQLSLVFDNRGLRSLLSPGDPYKASVLDRNGRFGDIQTKYRIGNGDWLNIYADERTREVHPEENLVVYTDYQEGMPVSMTQTYRLDSTFLDWTLRLETKMDFPVRIGELAIPIPWNKPYKEGQTAIFEESFTKHHFIAGNGSFLYFTKPSGNPPYLLITTKKGTRLEYFTSSRGSGYSVYVCSGLAAETDTAGSWRTEQTWIDLKSAGEEGSKFVCGLRFHWARSYDELREILYREGLIDFRVVPGMTIPSDLTARFSLHTRNRIDSVVAEYPKETRISFLGEKQKDHLIYEVQFSHPGENLIHVYYNGGEKTGLEFFSTEPLETLVKKRAAFIIGHQQHVDTTRWYDGLYSVYDMKNSVLRGPDNTDGFDYWWGYVLSCDDPALCKAPYLAAKNVHFPVDEEIRSIEYYLEHFVWNGLQRTDTDEPYPYGIYGTPNWKVCRDPELRAGVNSYNLNKMHIWRSYDYPHIFMLYYHMYQIARFYPEKVHYLDAAGYLERAYQTARAYWIYPYEILPWYETYKVGCYNELVVLDIIRALEEEGFPEKAAYLRNEWEKKVKYFVYDDPYPYGSEYSIDRTAFESSYALASYGASTDMKTDSALWFDKNLGVWYSHPAVSRADSRAFMERQHMAALSVRGWLEPKYFLLGSDWTLASDSHCMSYMSKMGGWAILDYGLNYADKPWDWLQLGYASYLGSWSLMNTGTEESNYGYWFPGKENDGAMGWAFMEARHGMAWIRKETDRGAWYYDGEADLGLGATFRMAQTILADDPLFGWIAYGGSLTEGKKVFRVIPRDGVRSAFSLVGTKSRLTLKLERDAFAAENPIVLSKDLRHVAFVLENNSGTSHQARMEIEFQGIKELSLTCNGETVELSSGEAGLFSAELPVKEGYNKVSLSVVPEK